MLQDYRKGLLLRVEGRGEDEEEPAARRLAEAVAALERELFLSGHYRAWGMVAGPCPFCETCNLAGPCRFPEKARPSMEACGIDVYATVRAAGWRIEVVPSLDAPFRLFGLVLVE
jgi:predicted metal-binding protein